MNVGIVMMREKKHYDYRAAHIANFILNSADKESRDVSILKLLKLVYIFFGWVSAFHNGKHLFSDPIEAWKYGPVVPSLYYDLRKFGRQPIRDARAYVYDTSGDEPAKALAKAPTEEEIADKDPELFETLKIIWDSYKDAPAEHLVALTHKEGTPWWNAFDGTLNKEIRKDDICRYYRKLYERLS